MSTRLKPLKCWMPNIHANVIKRYEDEVEDVLFLSMPHFIIADMP